MMGPFFKNHKNLFKGLVFLVVLGVLAFPFVRIVVIYGKSFFRSHLLELDQDARTVNRYSTPMKGESTEQFFEKSYPGKQSFGSHEGEEFDLEDYYNSVYQEYKFSENEEGLDVFYRKALDLKNEELQKPTALQKPKAPVKVGKKDAELLGDMRDLRFLHRFDDSDSAAERARDFQQSPPDQIAKQLDAEVSESTERIEFDKHVEGQEEAYKNYSSVVRRSSGARNHFYTSPKPTLVKNNSIEDLVGLRLILDKSDYYSFEIIRMNLYSPKSINLNDLKIYVNRGKYLFPNVGGQNDYFFKYKKDTIYGSLSMGYAPSPGKYTVLVKSTSAPKWKGVQATFEMKRRKVPSLQKGFSVLNLEYTTPLTKSRIVGPHGHYNGYESLIEWASYMDVDAFWMLVAQTTGWDKSLSAKSPWVRGGFKNLDLLGPLCRENNIRLGAYIMSYFTPGNGKRNVGYDPSLGYSASVGLEDSLHISLNCPRRLKDIIEVARQFNENPNVSFIGLDFIRTGRADGYEMGPQMIDDMNVAVPDTYHGMKLIDKIKWFAERVEDRNNKVLIAKWRWWRAHKVATIANTVIREAKLDKPLWVFTLGWEHGKQHGQDPYMFFDAGVFIDAVMLYEANSIQFRNMMIQWPNYMRDDNNNVVIGNASDIRFLDGTSTNTAIEYLYRTKRGYRHIYRDGFAKGIFMHDLSRALWSSKRGINIKDWAIVHGHATSSFRYDLGLIPYKAEAIFQDDKRTGVIKVENSSDKTIMNLKLNVVQTDYWKSVRVNGSHLSLRPYEVRTFRFEAELKPEFEEREVILGFELLHPYHRKTFFFTQHANRDLAHYLMDVR